MRHEVSASPSVSAILRTGGPPAGWGKEKAIMWALECSVHHTGL